jgi:flagellar hook-associated protein 3 FlgL
MQRNLTNLSKIQTQMSSMKNFSKPSDDPINVQRAMQLQTSIDYNAQYAVNIKAAQGWMQTTDTALVQLNTVLTKIRNNLEKGGGDGGYTQDEMDKINDEVNQEVSQIAQLLNTNFKGEYVFGGTAGLSKPVSTSTYDIIRSTDVYKGCVRIDYSDKDGNTVDYLPDVVSDGFDKDQWTSGNIKLDLFESDGTTVDKEITTLNAKSLDGGDPENIDDAVKNLNAQIQSNPDFRDKVNVVKTNDGNIKFLAVNSSEIIKISSTDIDNLSGVNGKQLSSMDLENIGASKNIEVSQGVVLDYNTTAVDVMKYGSGDNDDIRLLMDRIEHHMAGQVWDCKDAEGNKIKATDEGATPLLNADGDIEKDADGDDIYYTWVNNQDKAKEQLTNQDLIDIDAASKQVLKVDSQIGAKEKRMDGLSDQNSSSKVDMTDILSKTEDIDISEKTIEYATMITIYQACLQTGARIMQPTLMDYIS